MLSFQDESLFLAEEKLAGTDHPARFRRLYLAFRASFLHYSRLTPDHWRHPRGSWSDFPDLPSSGSCVVLAILACGPDPDEMAIRYHEFLGAVASGLSGEEAAFALLSAEAAGRRYPDDTRFPLLCSFLRKKAVPPETEAFRRARKIAEGLMRLTSA